MPRKLILVRHGAVAPRWQGVCYGRTDVELSEEGMQQSRTIAEQLLHRRIDSVWHSGAARTRVVAELVARMGASCIHEPALSERDFGSWEGRRWDDIYAETGAVMDGLMYEPAVFCPPGGETTYELRDRVLAWYASLPEDGFFVAVSHGGPIAALLGTVAGASPADWPRFIPALGTSIELATE